MRFKDLKESVEVSDTTDLVDRFVDFASEELGLDKKPTIILIDDGSLGTTFGTYVVGEYEIYVEIANRHPIDVLRTLAHEMVHYRQDLAGVLHADSGKDGSEHENEANAEAGRIMRKFGKANSSLYRSRAL